MVTLCSVTSWLWFPNWGKGPSRSLPFRDIEASDGLLGAALWVGEVWEEKEG